MKCENDLCAENINGICTLGIDAVSASRCIYRKKYLEQVDRWIPVGDGLLEEEVIAIGYQDEMMIGRIYKNGNEFEMEADGILLTNITHYQKKPAPPEKGE